MLLEADLMAKRATLRWLAQHHPQWTHQDLAAMLGMSRSWVSKWLQRLRHADPHDAMALHSRSRARHTPPASIAIQPAVVQRILEIRTAPPENLQRVPGPEAILYYLHHDPALKQAGVRLPRSQTPIWKILRQAGCMAQEPHRKPKPLELRQPGEEVQLDLKDACAVLLPMRSLSEKGEVEGKETSRTRPDPMRKLKRNKSMVRKRKSEKGCICCSASPVYMVRLHLSNPSFQRGNEALTAALLKRCHSNPHSRHLSEERSLL